MELIDSFGRKIDYIRLSVTGRCNLRCIYCVPEGRSGCLEKEETKSAGAENEAGEELSAKMILFLRAARKYGLKKVRITGGEPLLKKDIVTLVRRIKDIGIEDLSLTTNGQLLPLFAYKLRDAGLDRVNISIDSLRPGVYGRITGGGSLPGALRALSVAQEVFRPSTVKINMVPVRGINGGEIPDFARLTLDNPFHVRFIELMPVGRSAFGAMRITATEAKEAVSSAGALQSLGRSGSSDNYMLPGARGVTGFISPMSGHLCDSCNRMRITAAGKIRPCLFSSCEQDLNAASSLQDMERLLLVSVSAKAKGSLIRKAVQFDTMQQIGG